MESERVRIDKYLWAIRIFKTRSLAAEACENNKVKQEGKGVKPSKIVKLGDKYEIKTVARNWVIEVKGIINQRVAYSEAISNYIDQTPEKERSAASNEHSVFIFDTGKRQNKQARPTKKERRNLDDFFDY